MKNGKKFTGAYGGKSDKEVLKKGGWTGEKKEKSTIEKMNDVLKNRPRAKRRKKRMDSFKKLFGLNVGSKVSRHRLATLLETGGPTY